ncbi:hypothetical protein BT69DRAFT_1218600 [Atractiella rhizophila]|nr:hypothetical protein BT69DRAFT_1218600 [Atractiella rhizophila]
MDPPLPTSGTYVSSIRESCKLIREKYNIKISQEGVSSFLTNLKAEDYQRLKSSHGLAFPLKFESAVDELNVICLLSILNFLHGYRLELKARTGRGAWDTITYLVLSLYLSTESYQPLSTAHLASLTKEKLAEFMGLKTHVEKQHETLPIQIGEVDQDVKEIVELVYGVISETADILQKQKEKSFGSWMERALTESKADNEKLLKLLVVNFPAFRDAYEIDGQPVYLFKKALFLLNGISHVFSLPGRPTAPFQLPDSSPLPIFADNVIPTMLMHHSIFSFEEATEPSVRSLGLQYTTSSFPSPDVPPRLEKKHAAILRAASVDACSVIAKAGNLTEVDVDAYLWAVAKDTKELRGVTRWIERGTIMY